MENAGKLNMEEYQYFLTGGVVLDRSEQMDNPCESTLICTNTKNWFKLLMPVYFIFPFSLALRSCLGQYHGIGQIDWFSWNRHVL